MDAHADGLEVLSAGEASIGADPVPVVLIQPADPPTRPVVAWAAEPQPPPVPIPSTW